MQVVDEYGYSKGSGKICVARPPSYQCSLGCADLDCICGEWLLPAGWYVNPFDTSGMSFFQCASNGSHINTRACARGYIAIPGRGCVPRASAAIMTCAGKVMKGYGVCDVSFIGGPEVAAMVDSLSPQSGRRLVEAGSALEVAHAGMAALVTGAATAAGSNQTGWEPWHNAGRSLKDDFFNWDGAGYAIGDIRQWRKCDESDIAAADKLGCFSKADGKPLRQLAGFAGWPENSQSRAGAANYNAQNKGAGCWCAFKYACPNFLSARCKDPIVLRMVT
jgi:hypothetical protein